MDGPLATAMVEVPIAAKQSMVRRPIDAILDNPILTKHLRSRLRPTQVIGSALIVAAIGIAIVFAGYELGWHVSGWALAGTMALQLFVLAFTGSYQVGSAVGGAREAGILDYHRLSPVPPWHVAIGFFLGAPVREYLLFAITIPFTVVCGAMGPTGVFGALQLLVPIVMTSWLLQAFAMMTSLTDKKPKKAAQGAMGALILFSFIFGMPILWGLVYATTLFTGQVVNHIPFFGYQLYWLFSVALYEAVLIGFVLIGCMRKMRSDRARAYSKGLGIAFLASFTTLVLGAAWSAKGYPNVVIVVLYLLVLWAIVMTPSITPDDMMYRRGVRRALAQGRRRPPWYTDEASNRVAIVVYGAIVALGATIAWESVEGRPTGGRTVYSQAIAVGVFVAAYIGLGLQYFALRLGRRGGTFTTAVVMILWIVPMVAGFVLAASQNIPGPPSLLSQMLLGLSPISGIALSANVANLETPQSVRIAALMPPIALAFVFNYLLVNVQRRIDRALIAVSKRATDRDHGAPHPLDAPDPPDLTAVD